ncbi:hypothetical protein FRC15_002983 [Serendipita sp. 397]|nr:hypothetical protein FRC15_002983 [Serendipita sp. 397]
MSRGRGGTSGRGAGRGSGRGRGANALPAGLSFEDMIAASQARDPAPLYPRFPDLPVLANVSDKERQICKYQMGFVERLKKSPYYLVDTTKTNSINQVPRYSDRYKVVSSKLPTLEASNLDPKLFPKAIWAEYFEGGNRKHKKTKQASNSGLRKVNLDALEKEEAMDDEEEDKPKEQGLENEDEQMTDYDEDDEEFGDDDYVNNYFETGEGDGDDDFAGGDDEGGGD